MMPEIKRVVQAYISIGQSRSLVRLNTMEMKFYALKILEHRIRNKKMAGVLHKWKQPLCLMRQVTQVFAKLGWEE